MTLVVGLNGSPRRGGNSDSLLQEALRGAEEAGARIERYDLAFLNISPCRACEACFSDGDCVIQDDMAALYDALENADAVIVASPIYFSGMSAQTKAAVDRCQALWARRQVLKIPRRIGRGAIMLSAAQPNARFDNAVSELRAFLIGIGVRPTAALTFPGLEGPGSVTADEEAMASARSLGREIASQN